MSDNVQSPAQDTPDVPSTSVPVPVAEPTNPSASPSSQPTSLPPAPKPDVLTKTKPRKTKTKARPRRRVATSDVESDAADSDGSLTDPSSSGSEEEEEEEDDDEDDQDEVEQKHEVEEEANVPKLTVPAPDSKSAAQSGSAKEKGKGKGGSAGQRVFTEEEKAKFEEVKKRRKEKQKAKRAEIKEAKKKEREGRSAEGLGEVEGSKSVPGGVKDTQVATKKGGKKGKNADKVAGPSNSSNPTAQGSTSASTSAVPLEGSVPLTADGSPPSTSPVLPDSETPSVTTKGRRGSRSQVQRPIADPKITPRVGGFWTHDQRLQEADSFGGGWRGRGAPRGARGGFRGRGRGFGPASFSSFANQQPSPSGSGSRSQQELTANLDKDQEKGDDEENDGPMLEMDRLEKELAAKEKHVPSTSAPPPPKEKKWGHEAFEAIQTQNVRRLIGPVPVSGPGIGILRGGIRGRGRGRGGFVGRGGVFAQPFRPANGPISPAQAGSAPSQPSSVNAPSPALAPLAPPTTTSTLDPASAPTQAPVQSGPPAELRSTVPDADSLFGTSGAAVTVRLPGSSQSVEVNVAPPSVPSDVNGSSQSIALKPEVVAASASSLPTIVDATSGNTVPVPSPLVAHVAAPSPFPVGSDNGSIGSSGVGQFVPAQAQQDMARPTVTGYGGGAEFYPAASRAELNGQSRTFYPANNYAQGLGNGNAARAYPVQAQPQPRPHHHMYGQNFLPQHAQSQQPAFLQQQYSGPGPQSQRGSFSGPAQFYPQSLGQSGSNAYSDGGRGSPFNPSPNPYSSATGHQVGGYFVPARPGQKISIRAPTMISKESEGSEKGAPSYASVPGYEQQQYYGGQHGQQGYYPQHYNPYNVVNGNGLDQGQGGYADGEGYYPTGPGVNGQGYGWEGQNGGYGYEGEYGY